MRTVGWRFARARPRMSTKPEGRFPRGALRPPLPSAPPCKRVPPGAWHAAGAAARATPRVQQPRLFASVRLWSVAWRKMASPLARKGFMDTRCLQIALRNHCQHRRRSPPGPVFVYAPLPWRGLQEVSSGAIRVRRYLHATLACGSSGGEAGPAGPPNLPSHYRPGSCSTRLYCVVYDDP